jgi:hypothetical protein
LNGVAAVQMTTRGQMAAETSGVVHIAAQLTDLSAVKMTSVTASGWEIMMTCEPSISVILAPARSAIDRTTSLPAALSVVPAGLAGMLPARH